MSEDTPPVSDYLVLSRGQWDENKSPEQIQAAIRANFPAASLKRPGASPKLPQSAEEIQALADAQLARAKAEGVLP